MCCVIALVFFSVSSNRFVKSCSDPEIASANAVDVSLAPLIAVALIKSLIEIR